MSVSGSRVLVTGAGGFIGSHLCERLVAEGARVRAMVHYHALGSWGWLDTSARKAELEVVAGDILDRDSVKHAMEGTEVVFHLAALIAIPYSYEAPSSYVNTNIGGTVNVVQAARELGVARVVHTSTSEVYGTARSVRIDEEHPLQGQSPYSASKIGADKMADSFHASFGVPVVTLRPFNTYGPRQSARAVVPTIISQLVAGRSVKLGNLMPTRDLNYVDNMVDGYVRAATADGVVGETINLGSGREIAIGDLAARIASLMGKPLHIEEDRTRMRPEKSEVVRLMADNSKAGKLLGWRPSVTLEEGLKRTITWFEANAGLYSADHYQR